MARGSTGTSSGGSGTVHVLADLAIVANGCQCFGKKEGELFPFRTLALPREVFVAKRNDWEEHARVERESLSRRSRRPNINHLCFEHT